MIAYLDTHALLLLKKLSRKAFPRKARRLAESATELRVSPVVMLELQMLRELGRVNHRPADFLEFAARAFPVRLCELPFARVVDGAAALAWTRDPFDRLIAAQALLGNGELLTKDSVIRANCRAAVWD